MRPKSDYAIVTSSSVAYSFGLISTMNAQKYFGTDADWEIAYDGSWPLDKLAKLPGAFPFNVTLHNIEELWQDFKKELVDRRTDKTYPIDYWGGGAYLAMKLLREKKYKAICYLQADQFVFVNLDVYFKIAESGIMVSGEFPFSFVHVGDMPFGNDKGIWDRSMCGAFDSINFYHPSMSEHFKDLVQFQLEDIFKGESNHPMICHNRSICKHLKKDQIMGLDKNLWVADSTWGDTRIDLDSTGDRIYNAQKMRMSGWHARWWEEGRIISEWTRNKENLIANKNNPEFLEVFNRLEHNLNLTKSFMERFNAMTPEVASDIFVKGFVRRPRYELGEE